MKSSLMGGLTLINYGYKILSGIAAMVTIDKA